jgi:hypothetical protein
MALPSATDAEYVGTNGTGGVVVGLSASKKVGFYGKAPVAQRAYSSAVHATAGCVTSSSFGATQAAAVNEIQNTLIALGVWATA